MTEKEFHDWLEVHCLRFSGVKKLLENEPTILGVYFDRLSDYDQATAKAASDEIFAMESQPYPSGHLGKLVAICRASKFQSKRTEPVNLPAKERADCDLCGDRGTVYVYHPSAYKKIKDDNFRGDPDMKEIVVACVCREGQQFCNKSQENLSRQSSFPNMKKFDANTMLPMEGNDEAELVDFVMSRWKPHNFKEEFAAFA